MPPRFSDQLHPVRERPEREQRGPRLRGGRAGEAAGEQRRQRVGLVVAADQPGQDRRVALRRPAGKPDHEPVVAGPTQPGAFRRAGA